MSEQLPNLIEEVIQQTTPQSVINDASTVIAQSDEKELALLLESLPIEERIALWETIADKRKLDVLIEMRSDPREILIESTDATLWDTLFVDIEAEDLLELADSLPQKLLAQAYAAMDKVQKSYFIQANEYTEGEIGHWASHAFLVLPQNAKVRDGLRLIRRDIPRHCDLIFLTNRSGQFSEAVPIALLHTQPEHVPLVDIALDDISVINDKESCLIAAKQVQLSGYGALPIVDENQQLLGRLDVTTAAELSFEEYERQLMATAGMDEDEDLFAPVKKSAQNRAVWLGINLLTAFLASAFIGMFEATLQQVVALAVLMPVVASMGGIAGSQTLTLIIRGLALNQVSPANVGALLSKELKVGGLNGIIWALVIGVVAVFWFGDPMLGVVIGLAILLNIIAAATAGIFVPVILDKLKIDPALSGSVILTTVTDIVGFVAFLGLGTLFLL
ncbi:magnesium transporter [Pseudoalteromonas piratica]|uniref:Magnesium transporter n=1 Tax=Pseudoalteromonas piratica TaxID=1348114 RepID=A0A0A7EJT6_9GAMM|nr:magnesium transporter [Pseudoalteromonas piratica]AIY66813.1 magnesium transporter [Pseudoalteromonas piratica]